MTFLRTVLIACACLAGGATASTVAAQEATPDMAAQPEYPVAIHEGTCESPVSQPGWDIDNTIAFGEGDDDAEMLGTSTSSPVLVASATIDANIDDLGNGDWVIAVHASPDDFGTLVACGEIAGLKSDGRLVVPITPMADAGVSGIAILDEDTNGVLGLDDEEIQIDVYLMSSES